MSILLRTSWCRRFKAFLFAVFTRWRACRASNWAQVAGARVQNYAIPQEGGASSPLFSPRMGMALTSTNTTPNAANEWGHLFVLGGDSFVTTSTNNMATAAGERGGSYMNDVWVSKGPGWEVYSGGTKPMAKSTMTWKEVTPGRVPPAGLTYEDWIICQDVLQYRLDDASVCEDTSEAPGIYAAENMWSPRRNHGAVTVGDRMFVLGGRAREISDMPRERTVGGNMYPRVESDPFYSSWREPSVLKDDVWASDDGGAWWFLVSPGCHAPQAEDVLAGNEARGKHGALKNECVTDADCYGVGECRDVVEGTGHTTCVCPMWSPRELHAVAEHDLVIYVVGGFVSLRGSSCGDYACGDVDAGAYRGYKSDVWYSSDGKTWDAATLGADWPGRGDHGLFINSDVMYVVGGAADAGGGRTRYMNDVWRTVLPTTRNDTNSSNQQDLVWYDNYTTPTWTGRAGHQVVLEVPAPINSFSPRVYVIGGNNEGGILSDTWSWDVSEGGEWSEDYSEQQPYRSGVASTKGFVPGPPPQTYYYLDRDSPMSLLKRAFLPTFAPFELGSVEVELRALVTDEEASMLTEAGVHTVSDLVSADKYTVLRLRGYDATKSPLADGRLSVTHICELRNLAIALVEKCTMDSNADLYNGEDGQPWNVEPVFSGGKPTVQYARWYGADYTVVGEGEEEETDDVNVDELIEAWDGCTYVEALGESPDVPGIGEVTQISNLMDISQALGGLRCKTNPGPRTHATSAYFNQKLLLIGGRAAEDELMNDAWYRDDRTPTAFVATGPLSYTSNSDFDFTCDEQVCYYEVRVFDGDENLEVVAWTEVVDSVDTSFLNRWTGGPGSGEYILYVRAVDPAGNTDFSFREGINMHTWNYVSPLPWGIIMPIFFSIILLMMALYFEYRRRKKKHAMERYAMKRMRRKFKHQQKKESKAVNWRDVYNDGNKQQSDAKDNQKKKQKKKKKKKKEEYDYDKDGKNTKKKKKKDKEKKKATDERRHGKKKKKESDEREWEKLKKKSSSKWKSRSKSSKSRSRSKDRRDKRKERHRRGKENIRDKNKSSKEKEKKSTSRKQKRERAGEKREKEKRRERSSRSKSSKSPSASKKTKKKSKTKKTKRSCEGGGGGDGRDNKRGTSRKAKRE